MADRRRVVRFLVFVTAIFMAATAFGDDVPAARFDGSPKFSAGRSQGYFIWKDGTTWKLRWTTLGTEHRFSGEILVEGGRVLSMKRFVPEPERRPSWRVSEPSRRTTGRPRDDDRIEKENESTIRFRARTAGDADGVDFTVTQAAREIRFILQIDGKSEKLDVTIGRSNFQPKILPVVAQLR